MRAGAFDFVVKPVSPERIAASVGNALKVDRGEGRVRTTRRSRSGAVSFGDIVSASPAMPRVIDLAPRAAQSPAPVVLDGDPGVGRELTTRSLKSGTSRRASWRAS